MKKVSLTLDEEVIHWARTRAAERNTSLSRLIGELLREKMQKEERYRIAMEDFLARKPQMLRKAGIKLPSREELHDR